MAGKRHGPEQIIKKLREAARRTAELPAVKSKKSKPSNGNPGGKSSKDKTP